MSANTKTLALKGRTGALAVAALLGASVALVSPRPAAAQALSPADKALAESLFKEGKRLMDAKKHAEACPKLAESHRIAPKLGTLLNLATCHEEEGKTASAWAEFTEAASLAAKSKEPKREKYAREHAEDVEKKLSKLVVEVAGGGSDVEVTLSGKALGKAAWGTPFPVDPGDYEVEATAPGKKRWSQKVTAEPGPATQRIKIPALEKEASAAASPAPAPSATEAPAAALPPPPPDSGDGGGGQRVAGFVIMGVGLAGIGVGSYFGLQTFSLKRDSDAHCNGTLCDQEGVDMRADAKTAATLSTIGFAAGAACVAGGLILALTAGSSSKPASGLWVAPVVMGSRGSHVTLGGAF